MISEHRNLVILLFADKSNEDLFKVIHSLKFDYKFDIKTHNSGEPLDKNNKNYDKIMLVIHGDNDGEFEEIHKDIKKYDYSLEGFESIILSSIKDCSPWMLSFKAEICINISDLENSKRDLKKVMNRTFKELDKMNSHHEVIHTGEHIKSL
jgi:hypothetical protein